MVVQILIALFSLLSQPTLEHYIGNLDECTLSKTCNHTWVPTCGHSEADSNYRLFLDECDLHEYNCDNTKLYVGVEVKVCSEKCTQSDQSHIATTPLTPTVVPSTTAEVSTHTSEEKHNISSTTEVIETTTDKTDTPTIFVAPTTIETTTAEPRHLTSETTEITTKPTETIVTTQKIEESSKYDVNNTNEEENTIPEDENTIPEDTTQFTTVVTTTTKANTTCFPKKCTLPSTWETTAVGETRDFFQILRERYGNKIKFLSDTTHFPKEINYVRRSVSFLPGSHYERRRMPIFIYD